MNDKNQELNIETYKLLNMKPPTITLKSLAIAAIIISFISPIYSQPTVLAANTPTHTIEMSPRQISGTISLIPAFHCNETMFFNLNFENVSNATVVIKDEKGKSVKRFFLAGDEEYFVLYSHTLCPGRYVCQLCTSDTVLTEIKFNVLGRRTQ